MCQPDIDMPLPMIAKVWREYPDNSLPNPCGRLQELLAESGLDQANLDGKSIAVAVGSRGIAGLCGLLGTLLDFLKRRGANPFIVPAMGSHGGATAEGQTKLLASLGVTRGALGTPVKATMETVRLGEARGREFVWPVTMDKYAAEADGIILVNRVKAHTDFSDAYESGIAKMLAVGLGNEAGARSAHSRGVAGLREVIPAVAEFLLGAKPILAGVAVVENARHRIAALEVLPPDVIMRREPELLKMAKQWMGAIPVSQLDGLVISWMGKEISGTGIDTNVIGRRMIRGEPDPVSPRIDLIGVCDLTPASAGNALGVGLADFTTSRLAAKYDRAVTAMNVLSSTFIERGKLPLVLPTDKMLVETMAELAERKGKKPARIVFIRDTMSLSEFYVTEPLVDEILSMPGITLKEELKAIPFRAGDCLALDWEGIN